MKCAYLLPLLFFTGFCLTGGSAQTLNRSGVDSTIFVSHAVFLPGQSMASGQQNWCIASGDFNHDGLADVVVGSKLDGKVHLHLANGEGAFSHAGQFATRPDNRALVLFDANADGEPDLATVTMRGELCLLLNQGNGRFGQAKVWQLGGLLQDVVATDVDGDGDQDLLVAATSAQQVIWMKNEGNGQMVRAGSWPTGREPRSLALGDLDGDGSTDMVAGCDDGTITLFRGENGGFRRLERISSGSANWSVLIADLNGDGRSDIATASYLDKWLSIHLQKAGGQFPIAQQILSGDHNFDLVAADFDLDGDLDLATCSTLDKAIGFHLNDGAGHFSARHDLPSGDWNAGMAVADFDQDGDPDLMVASINDHQIHLHRNSSISPAREQDDPAVCLSGYVMDGDQQATLPRVPVSLRKAGAVIATTLTDEKGFFSFCEVVPGEYVLLGRAPGFPPGEQAFTMPDTDFQQDLLLYRGASTFLYGLITNTMTRERLPGALVQIRDSAGQILFTLTADSRGTYKTPINPGNYRVKASLEGFDSASVEVWVKSSSGNAGTRADLSLTPIPTDACLVGTVFDAETGNVIPLAWIAIRDEDGNPVKKIQAKQDGSYRVCLPFGEYEFSTTARGYFFQVDSVKVTEPEPESELRKDIFLKPLKENAHIVLRQIYFDVDKATLRPESVEELERVLAILTENPSLVVSIEGHTDSDATDSYNQDLSHRRAKAVVDYLASAGVSMSRLEYKGYGEARPVAPNDSPANKQLNRRTEFRVVKF